MHRWPPSGLNSKQLCASTRADGCRPSEADSEPRVATGIVSQKVSHGGLRAWWSSPLTHRSSSRKIACVDRNTQTILGVAKVVGGWEEGRREWGTWGGPQRQTRNLAEDAGLLSKQKLCQRPIMPSQKKKQSPFQKYYGQSPP